ncbi:ATP-binding protein [Dactylosporangium sp. NPDC049742]|uniref:ATP-binding protein n=1 Tax=Dactylosporangium sp. NPDC049742 TaxID=3154737 RepID=UPI0034474561
MRGRGSRPAGAAAAGRAGDPARLETLHATGLLHAGGVPSLDRLTRLARRAVGAPVALVSLVDADRQVFVSAAGPTGARDSALAQASCRTVVDDGAPLVIRAAERPDLVAAFVGYPLRTPDGQVLGCFCVADHAPRQWSAEDLDTVADLAGAAEVELALRLANSELLLASTRTQAVLDSAADAFVSLDAAGTVLAWNLAAERMFGRSAAETLGRPAGVVVAGPSRDAFAAWLTETAEAAGSGSAGTLEVTAVDRAGRRFPIEVIGQPYVERDRPVIHAFVHDLSPRQAARRQLDAERTFQRALLDSLDTAVVACDGEGRIATVNRAFRDAHPGVAVEPTSAPNWAGTYQLYAADGRRRLRPDQVPLARAFAGEHVHGEEMVVGDPGGPQRRFLCNGQPIDAPDGGRLGAVVAMHDITDAHGAERLRGAQLAVAEALTTAAGAAQAAGAVVEAVTVALDWALGEYWHVDPDAGVADRLGVWVSPGRARPAFVDDAPPAGPGDGMIGRVWSTGRPQWLGDIGQLPYPSPRRDDALAAGLHAAIGLPVLSGGTVLGVLVFATERLVPPDPDVLAMLDGVCAHIARHIERLRADDLSTALAAARRDFDRVVANVNDFVWTVEVLPDRSVRSVYASPDGGGVFGSPVPAGTDLATVLADRVHPEDHVLYGGFHASLAADEPAEMEVRVTGFDGVTRWVWTRAVPRREGGRLFLDGMSTNVTERRILAEHREELLAEQRQQVRRLREVDRMKDDLVALVSHELRNPIGTILGYAEIIGDEPGVSDDVRHYGEVIRRHSSHMQQLVDDLLDLARLGSASLAVDPRPVPLTRFLREAVEDHRPAADAKGVALRLEAAANLTVRADPARLRQVLDNLLSNAVKYTPGGGTVTVTVAATAAGAEGPASVSVTDTGIGIPAEQYQQLFTRFFRASTALAHGIKGTGLGLAVTKAIIDAHHGTIAAGPADPTGTTFTFTLP